MSKLHSQSVFVALAIAALTALVTGVLRAWWVWWGPVVSMLSRPGIRSDPLWLMIGGLVAGVLVMLERRGRRLDMAAGVAGVVIGFAVGSVFADHGDPPRASSREYATMMYVLNVAAPSIASSDIRGGMLGTTIAVVDEAGISNSAIRLRRAICEGSRSGLLTHIITVGGPDAAVTGRVLQRAVRWLPKYRGSSLEIVIVTPSPIPDDVKQALKKKGLKFREIEHGFPDPLPQGGLMPRQGPRR